MGSAWEEGTNYDHVGTRPQSIFPQEKLKEKGEKRRRFDIALGPFLLYYFATLLMDSML